MHLFSEILCFHQKLHRLYIYSLPCSWLQETSKRLRFQASCPLCSPKTFPPSRKKKNQTGKSAAEVVDNGKFVKAKEFAGPGHEVTNSVRGQQAESFKGDNKVRSWFQRQFPWKMSQVYDSQYSEFAVAVGAASYVISSLEEAEAEPRRKMREELDKSRNKMKSLKEETRQYSRKEERQAGETSTRKLAGPDYRTQKETALAVSKPSGFQTPSRPKTTETGVQRQKEDYPRRNSVVGTKADAWERSQIEKISKRYEKMKISILAWENEKKKLARIKMERRKRELDERRTRDQLYYQAKVARIDHIAGGARAQVEKKRKNDELSVKDKARQMRATGKVPMKYCFCF